MKPAPFTYAAPRSVEEAVALLQEHGAEAKLLAGGQSLVPLMNLRLAKPRHLIDLNRIAALDYIRPADGGIIIGAMTRQAALEHSATARETAPLLVDAAKLVGHPTIRHRGQWGEVSPTPTRRPSFPLQRSPWKPSSPCRAPVAPA